MGIDRFTSSVIEVSIADDRKIVIDGARLHRIADLVPEHITTIGPIPVTTRLRTLVDLGAVGASVSGLSQRSSSGSESATSPSPKSARRSTRSHAAGALALAC